MQILIAPNAFKNSLTADKVAEAIEAGFVQSSLKCRCILFPIGDGGDGTGKLLITALGGKMIKAIVQDPIGKKIESQFGLVKGGETAIIEMADASGLRLLEKHELNPLVTNSYGTGELIIRALDNNVKNIILCLGGSATVDGASGILMALGFRFLDKNKVELKCLPADLCYAESLDLTAIDKRIFHCKITILSDVINPLLGEHGAAQVFGPQKGASDNDILILESGLKKLCEITRAETGNDVSTVVGGGAAGGVAAIMHGLLNASIVNGIDYFLNLTGFEDVLKNSDLVITGEGSIDDQTLQGKGPFGVAKMARNYEIPVIALAGKVPLEDNKALQYYFQAILAIHHEPCELSSALETTESNLIRTSKAIGDILAMKKH